MEKNSNNINKNDSNSPVPQVQGIPAYDSIKSKLCDSKKYERVLTEVASLNEDFVCLRTYMGAVSDYPGIFHFILCPVDGALADMPLCGRMIIPAGYPEVPPIIQMLTKTGRKHIDDGFRFGQDANIGNLKSTPDIDLLKPRNSGGLWSAEYTVSAVFANLFESICNLDVLQTNGKEKAEYVTTKKLQEVKDDVAKTFRDLKHLMPSIPKSNKAQASPTETKYFELPESFQSLNNKQFVVVKSQGIDLQVPDEKKNDQVFSIGFDLTDLQNNPETVFSIVLSNDPEDHQGRKQNTVLVRNGITATAAKKVKNAAIKWFVHGRPMKQDGLKVIVTVGYDQFCISFTDTDGMQVIHGDLPVSCLGTSQIGDVKNEKFYLSALLKNNNQGRIVTIKTFKPEVGFVHPLSANVIEERPVVIEGVDRITIGEGSDDEKEHAKDVKEWV